MEKTLSRRDALKILAAATGGIALSTLPVWKRPFVGVGALPAFAQTSRGTDDLLITLSWDQNCGQDGGDRKDENPFPWFDLYVQEPDGSWVYWDNYDGTTVTMTDGSSDTCDGPFYASIQPGGASSAGPYKIYVDFYHSYFPLNQVTATIVIRSFVGTNHEQSRTITRQFEGSGTQGATITKVANVTFPAGSIIEQTGTITGPYPDPWVNKGQKNGH